MKKDIILSGVGGQGIISIASVIGLAALKDNLFLKQSEVHGMSQRGGDVMSNLRISDKPIASDLIAFGNADLIISMEPLECLRYLPYLSKDGWLITNIEPFVNIPNYPDIDKIFAEISKVKNNITLNADNIAKELNARKSTNIVLLGAATPFLGINKEKIENAIEEIFAKKGEDIFKQNLDAFRVGLQISNEKLK